MTPKEKAEFLFREYLVESPFEKKYYDVNKMSKECALIAIEFAKEFIGGDLNESFDKFLYLQDVKKEIEKK